jgi:hypothetical protein
MLDRPDAAELLEALAAFLSEDAAPALDGRRRFHALVAANVARILAREARTGPQRLVTEVRELWALLGRAGEPPAGADVRELVGEMCSELCARIDAGDADDAPWGAQLVGYLKASIGRRLDIDAPEFRR